MTNRDPQEIIEELRREVTRLQSQVKQNDRARRTVIVSDENNRVRLFKTESGKFVFQDSDESSAAYRAEFSKDSDGKWVEESFDGHRGWIDSIPVTLFDTETDRVISRKMLVRDDMPDLLRLFSQHMTAGD